MSGECTGCNSTPCVCGELLAAQRATLTSNPDYSLQLAVTTVRDYLLWLGHIQGVRLGAYDVVMKYADELREAIYRPSHESDS